jgi:hypothetical protein
MPRGNNHSSLLVYDSVAFFGTERGWLGSVELGWAGKFDVVRRNYEKDFGSNFIRVHVGRVGSGTNGDGAFVWGRFGEFAKCGADKKSSDDGAADAADAATEKHFGRDRRDAGG